MTTVIDWARLHVLTEAVAADAPSWPPNFGGTGVFCHVAETSFGLAQLYSRAGAAISGAWDALHKMRGPAASDPQDSRIWGVVSPSGEVLRIYHTQRGARSSAARRGDGEARLTLCPRARARRIDAHHERLRRALRYALAAGELHRAVVLALGGVPMRSVICGVEDGRLSVTGLRWYLGETNEGADPPVEAVRAFIGGGSVDGLRTALLGTSQQANANAAALWATE